jgi:hypothetical protein
MPLLPARSAFHVSAALFPRDVIAPTPVTTTGFFPFIVSRRMKQNSYTGLLTPCASERRALISVNAILTGMRNQG